VSADQDPDGVRLAKLEAGLGLVRQLAGVVEQKNANVKALAEQNLHTQERLKVIEATNELLCGFLAALVAEVAEGNRSRLDELLERLLGMAEQPEALSPSAREVVLPLVDKLRERAELFFLGLESGRTD